MLKLYIGRKPGRMVCLELPDFENEIENASVELGDAKEGMPIRIQKVQTSIPYLEERLKGLDYEKKKIRDDLDFLARRIACLTRTEQDVFSAVLRMEDPKTLEEMINLSYNLDQYELLSNGTDHEQVSSAGFLRHKGEISPSRLVVKKEGAVLEEVYGKGDYLSPGYEKNSLLLIDLFKKDCICPGGGYNLSLPASPERIALAKERLGIKNLDGCIFQTRCRRDDLTDYLPVGFSVEEMNQAAIFFAEKVLDGTRETFLHLLAVLEAECPRTLEEVLEVAGNLEDYRICPKEVGSQEDVHHVPKDREGGYSDGFTGQFADMEQMTKALMAKTGAVETSLGIVTSGNWRFRSFAKEPVTTRLIGPLKGNFYKNAEWGDGASAVRDSRELLQYADAIRKCLDKEDWSQEKGRGLAEYMDHRLLKQRVMSIFPGIEEIGGGLYGMANVVSRGALTPQELEAVMKYWSGQLLDGWGEEIEQRKIVVDGGELYISFWQYGDTYEILTENEFSERLRENSGLQMGGM